jgi:hypothetical protein
MQRLSHEPFRDELAGALVRIDHLEAENRELRAQVAAQAKAARMAQLTDEPGAAVLGRPSRASLLLPLATSWGLLMTATLVRFAAHEPPDASRHDGREHCVVMQMQMTSAAVDVPEWTTRPPHGLEAVR